MLESFFKAMVAISMMKLAVRCEFLLPKQKVDSVTAHEQAQGH